MDIKKFKGAIFDLDGTLLDSMNVWEDVDKEFFRRRNLDVPPEYIEEIKNMHLAAAAVYTKEKYHIEDSPEDIVKEWLSLCNEAYLNDVALKEGAYLFLEKLHNNGIKMAFATASEKEVCEAPLKKHGIFRFFSASAYVSEINIDKTHPDIYLLAAKRLGLKASECIVFEDIIDAIKSAKKGNFTVCGVYDPNSAKDEEIIRNTADYYIKSFKELL